MVTSYGYRWEDVKPFMKKPMGNRKNFSRFVEIAQKKYLEAYFSTLWLCRI